MKNKSPAETIPPIIGDWIGEQRKVLARPEVLFGIRTAVYHEAVRIRSQLMAQADNLTRFCEELKQQEVQHDKANMEKIYGQ